MLSRMERCSRVLMHFTRTPHRAIAPIRASMTPDMMTNREMTEYMCAQGYANDTQCHLRGMTRSPSRVRDEQMWLALKLSQNAVVLQSDEMVKYMYQANDGCARARAFKRSGAPVIPLWMKERTRWRFKGMYRFDAPAIAEQHRVMKRGQPYVTDRYRVGVRVTDELWLPRAQAGMGIDTSQPHAR